MSSGISAWTLFVLVLAGSASAQQAPQAAEAKETAPALVRRGNQLLLNDKPGEAIEVYDEAQQVAPEAREIAFGKGLGYYKLGEFDKARTAFEEAAAAKDDALADDALYSIGTVDHAQALAGQESDPKAAMSKLESAMQSYQGVLARNAEHEAARDANLKAATMWRQIKQQMQQQQQQQQQQQSDQNSEENQDQEQQQQSQQQEQQDQQQQEQEQQQEQNQEQQSQQPQDQQEQQQQEQQQSEPSEEQQEQEQQQSSSEQQEQAQQQAAEQKEQMSEEDVSREQAERQLREMLQALRDRKKERKEQAKTMPVQRGTKDW